MFKKNIGKRIQSLAVILAILSAVAFLALAAFYLISAITSGDDTLLLTGIIGCVLCVAGAVIAPLSTWILYGFGSLIINREEQLAIQRETKELLRAALSDGALSEEIARKVGQAVSKVAVAAPPAARPVAKPVARSVQPVAQPVQPVAPAPAPIAPQVPAAPVPVPVAPVAPPPATAPQTPAAPAPTPVPPPAISKAPTPPAQPMQPLTPFGGNNQTY